MVWIFEQNPGKTNQVSISLKKNDLKEIKSSLEGRGTKIISPGFVLVDSKTNFAHCKGYSFKSFPK